MASDLGERQTEAVQLCPSFMKRVARYVNRSIIWGLTGVDRLKVCGRLVSSNVEKVMIKVKNGTVYTIGVCVCASVWLCPVCSVKILVGRVDEIAKAMCMLMFGGGSAWMVIFTVCHVRKYELAVLFDVLSDAFRKLVSGNMAYKEKVATGKIGTINSREVMYGKNGWHPYMYVLVCFEGHPDLLALVKLM